MSGNTKEDLMKLIKQDDEMRKRRKTNPNPSSKPYQQSQQQPKWKDQRNDSKWNSSNTQTSSSSFLSSMPSLAAASAAAAKGNQYDGGVKYRDRALERRKGKDVNLNELDMFDIPINSKANPMITISQISASKGLDLDLLHKIKEETKTKQLQQQAIATNINTSETAAEKEKRKKKLLDIYLQKNTIKSANNPIDHIVFHICLSSKLKRKRPQFSCRNKDEENKRNKICNMQKEFDILTKCGFFTPVEDEKQQMKMDIDKIVSGPTKIKEEKKVEKQSLDMFDMFGEDDIGDTNSAISSRDAPRIQQQKLPLEQISLTKSVSPQLPPLPQSVPLQADIEEDDEQDEHIIHENLPSLDDLNATELVVLLKYLDMELESRKGIE